MLYFHRKWSLWHQIVDFFTTTILGSIKILKRYKWFRGKNIRKYCECFAVVNQIEFPNNRVPLFWIQYFSGFSILFRFRTSIFHIHSYHFRILTHPLHNSKELVVGQKHTETTVTSLKLWCRCRAKPIWWFIQNWLRICSYGWINSKDPYDNFFDWTNEKVEKQRYILFPKSLYFEFFGLQSKKVILCQW